MNAREVNVLEQIVRPHPNKKDILMIYHIRGTFFEAFELVNFPFDGQGLTITAVVLNRSDGPFAVDLVIDRPKMFYGVDFAGFYHHSSWILRELLAISAHSVGFVTKDGRGNEYAKRFPAVSIEGEGSALALARRPPAPRRSSPDLTAARVGVVSRSQLTSCAGHRITSSPCSCRWG